MIPNDEIYDWNQASRLPTNQVGPRSCTKCKCLEIGMIDAQPGCPAFVKTFHSATIIKMAKASPAIQKTGPGLGLVSWMSTNTRLVRAVITDG